MSNDFLTRMYWDCSDELAGSVASIRLNDLYERLEEVRKADDLFCEVLYGTSLTNGEKELLIERSAGLTTAFERQGFINGFRFGMKLAEDLREGACPDPDDDMRRMYAELTTADRAAVERFMERLRQKAAGGSVPPRKISRRVRTGKKAADSAERKEQGGSQA